MEFKEKFTPQAAQDLNDILQNNSSKKNQKLFLKQMDKSIELIKKHPESAPVIYKNYRAVRLLKVPFKIIYTIAKPVIYIVAIWHQKRSERWKDRIK